MGVLPFEMINMMQFVVQLASHLACNQFAVGEFDITKLMTSLVA